MNKIALLTIAIVSLALFVLPNTISMFVGQHTFEAGVQCQKCHAAEYAELCESTTTLVAHKRAANNTNYTTFISVGGIKYYPSNSTIRAINSNKWVWNGTWDGGNGTWENGSEHRLVSLDFNGDGGIDGAEICHLCHNASLFGIEDAHAVTVRVCDDDRCHGNRNHAYTGDAADLFANPSAVEYVVTAGYNLSRENVHQSFYLNLSNQSSTYAAGHPYGILDPCGNAHGSELSRGHWTCVGCHSDVGTDVTLNPHPVYNHSDANAAPRRYW
ncbi:MAG: hypothetical protein U9Q37_05000 [Euryarchaeota archaeon]|nr:hypothetical protein [Euryarchaeota archaeon]